MVNIDVATPKNECQQSVNRAQTEREQLWVYCIWYKPRAKLWLLSIIEVLATCIGNVVIVIVTTRKD